MKIFLILWGMVLCVSFGCTEQRDHAEEQAVWHTLSGRDDGSGGARPVIYRVKAPKAWERHSPSETESIADTTKALGEFLIKENDQTIRITIHNFPTDVFENRIPPASQIARWKRQITSIDPASVNIHPIAHGGFAGLYFEAEGNGIKVIGWSMQLGVEHYRNLISPQNTYRQLRADYTIKAVGPVELMERHKLAVINFANSFEFIEEIPARP